MRGDNGELRLGVRRAAQLKNGSAFQLFITSAQIGSGRLLAYISACPGQCGRADGYILEVPEVNVVVAGEERALHVCCQDLPQEPRHPNGETASQDMEKHKGSYNQGPREDLEIDLAKLLSTKRKSWSSTDSRTSYLK